MSKRFSRHRLKKKDQSGKKNPFVRFAIFIIVLFVLLFLLPIFQIFLGPFRSFAWNISSFWNSTVLILIQNEAEIRPSGGFLSAIGILDIQHGVPKITILDSYSIDDPPTNIRAPKAIEEVFSKDSKYKGWVFRDANFSPDFPESVRQVLEFLKYDSDFSNTKIDAVVAINFEAVRDLFEEFGPVNGLTADTLFQSLQRETKDIDLHSTQELQNRKNTLGESAKEILDTIGYFHLPLALKILAHSADKKDIQMWFSDPSLQKIASEKKWDGSLPLEEFYSVNMANLGAKKSDRYLFKHYYSDISVAADGSVREDFSLQYRHRGVENLSSGPGFYFVRIFRPYGTTLLGDPKEWSQKTTVGQMEEFSKMIFLVPGETKEESVSFSLPGSWKAGDRSFYWSAQSGSMDDLSVTIRHAGDAFFVAEGCDQQYSRENVIFCFSELDSDHSFTVRLYPDTLPPILENIFFENEKEIAVRFSESISSRISDSDFLIRCEKKELTASNIFRNQQYPRDVRVILSKPTELNDEFCKLEWKGIFDEFENKTDITMTIPLRK